MNIMDEDILTEIVSRYGDKLIKKYVSFNGFLAKKMNPKSSLVLSENELLSEPF